MSTLLPFYEIVIAKKCKGLTVKNASSAAKRAQLWSMLYVAGVRSLQEVDTRNTRAKPRKAQIERHSLGMWADCCEIVTLQIYSQMTLFASGKDH